MISNNDMNILEYYSTWFGFFYWFAIEILFLFRSFLQLLLLVVLLKFFIGLQNQYYCFYTDSCLVGYA